MTLFMAMVGAVQVSGSKCSPFGQDTFILNETTTKIGLDSGKRYIHAVTCMVRSFLPFTNLHHVIASASTQMLSAVL